MTRFPLSLLPEDDVKTSSGNETMTPSGCVTREESIDFSKLPLDAPIILFFHSGGLILGSAHSTAFLMAETAQDIMAQDYLDKLPKAEQTSTR